MNGPEVLSLKQAGDSATLLVQSCAPLGIGKYPEIEIVGSDGTRLCAVRMPQSSAERQFKRIGLSYADAIGKALTISRDPNQVDTSKPFWGVTLAKGLPATNGKANGATHTQSPEFGGPIAGLDEATDDFPPTDEAFRRQPDAADKLDGLFQLYDVCFDHASSIARRNATLAPDVAAMAATLFIAATGRGIRV